MTTVSNGWQKQSGFGWFARWHPEKKVAMVYDSWFLVSLIYLESLNDIEAKKFELYFHDNNLKGMITVIKDVKR